MNLEKHITYYSWPPPTQHCFLNTYTYQWNKRLERNILENPRGSHVAFYYCRRKHYESKSIIDGKHSLQTFTTSKQVKTM